MRIIQKVSLLNGFITIILFTTRLQGQNKEAYSFLNHIYSTDSIYDCRLHKEIIQLDTNGSFKYFYNYDGSYAGAVFNWDGIYFSQLFSLIARGYIDSVDLLDHFEIVSPPSFETSKPYIAKYSLNEEIRNQICNSNTNRYWNKSYLDSRIELSDRKECLKYIMPLFFRDRRIAVILGEYNTSSNDWITIVELYEKDSLGEWSRVFLPD